jgi:site-specific recombinase XerD
LPDIANLKQNNIVNERLVYSRQKTGKRISIPLSDSAKQIIQKYTDKCSTDYIFPILNDNMHKTEAQRYRRRKKVLRNVNANLRTIAKMLNIDIDLTTYVARHSYATVLKRSGVNIALIGETLGHSDLKTTQIYLDDRKFFSHQPIFSFSFLSTNRFSVVRILL